MDGLGRVVAQLGAYDDGVVTAADGVVRDLVSRTQYDVGGRVVAQTDADAPASGKLLRASRKDGSLTHAGLTTRAATARVRLLGEAIGVANLSAHDVRHSWATAAARGGTPIDRLTDAGGWKTPLTPLKRYVAPAQVANMGVRLALEATG